MMRRTDKYYWIDTEANGGKGWALWVRDEYLGYEDEEVMSGVWPEDLTDHDARKEYILDEAIFQIEEELGFCPYFDVD